MEPGVKLYEQKVLSSTYANVRQQYPEEWAKLILEYAGSIPRNVVLDVACGSGQAAKALASHFKRVLAIDQSSTQIRSSFSDEAQLAESGIEFFTGEAEDMSNIDDGIVDVLVVAQALHWFDLSKFFAEANRVMHSGSVFAASVYGPEMNFAHSPEITGLITSVLNKLWTDLKEVPWTRAFVNHYKDISFPFTEVEYKTFQIKRQLTSEQVIDWITTWAALQTFKNIFPDRPDPTLPLIQQLKTLLPEESEITWKATLVLGRKS